MPKTLHEKLGLKDGMSGWALGCPQDLAEDLALPPRAPASPDVIVAFVRSAAEITPVLAKALPAYRRGAALWFAYPKKSGAIASDITRDRGWEPVTARDLLPVTQIALDGTWSALRFRYRDEIKTLTRKF